MQHLLLLLSLGLLACTSAPAPGPPGPSVLLITLDTTRADRLGPYGYPGAQTPTWDAIAERGTVYTRAYSTQPLTIPSHSSIMTGRVPPSHGVRDNGDFTLSDEAITLAERFRAAGWRTAAFTSAFPTHRRWGFAQGFDVYRDPMPRLPTQLDWRDQRRADEVIDDALDILPQLDGSVFAWVHLFDAHWPYDPPEPFATEFSDRPYDGEIAFTDSESARLISWWEQAHPDSIILVTADHGEALGDGGEQTHGFLLHDGTIRVPLIVAGPGMEAGARIEDPVSTVDIAPTLLALAGLAPHPEIQGTDLREGGTALPYQEALTGMYNLGLAPLHALTDADGRYTEGAHGAWYPVSGDRVSVVAEGADLLAHSQRLNQQMADFDIADVSTAALDAAALEMLSALGYLGGGDPTAQAGDIDPRDVIDVIPLTWQARRRIGNGMFTAAEELLDRLDQRMPGAWGVEHLRADLLWRSRRIDEAYAAYTELYLRSPSSTLALQLANISLTVGDWMEAESWYIEALREQPNSPEAMAGRVRALQAQGRQAEAEGLADQYLIQVPDHAELKLLQAEMLLSHHHNEQALAQANEALQAMPWSAWAHTVTGMALWETGQADPAIERLKDAVSLAPFDVRIRMHLAECLMDVQRNAEAVRILAPLARLLPQDEAIAEMLEKSQAAVEASRTRVRRPGTGYIRVKPAPK